MAKNKVRAQGHFVMSKINKKHNLCIPEISELLPSRKYQCQYDCGKVFKNRAPYDLHLKRKHNVCKQDRYDLFKCPVEKCEYVGARLLLLRRHYQACHMKKNFDCHKCDRKFITSLKYERHKCENCAFFCKICSETCSQCTLLNCNKTEGAQIIMTKNSKVERPKRACKQRLRASSSVAAATKEEPVDSDDQFIEEFAQLLDNIKNKSVTDEALIKELANLTATFKKMQSEV